MYIAETKEKELIFADQAAVSRKETYYCPGCKQKVFYKSGQRMAPHFSHYAKEACRTFSEGETKEHLAGKKQLYKWLLSSNECVEMEAYLPELKQRPDLLWRRKGKKSLAIEFQCSPLPRERMIERTKGYKNNGYEVLWILGKQYHIGQKLTAFQKLFMTEIEGEEPTYLQYSVDKKKLDKLTHFSVKGGTCLSIQKEEINLNKEKWQRLFSLSKDTTENKRTKVELQKEQIGLNRLSYYRTKKARRFFQLLYENKENVPSLPLECYESVPYEWMVDTYSFEWKYRCLKWVESFRPKRVITSKMVRKWIRHQRNNRYIVFHECPLLNPECMNLPVFSYLDHLVKSGVLKKLDDSKWTYCKRAQRLQSLGGKWNQ